MRARAQQARAWHAIHIRWVAGWSAATCTREETIRRLLQQLEAAVCQTGLKNTTILSLSSELGAHLHAFQICACKSGKDRTAMLVTLEECCVLVRRYGLPFSQFRLALNLLREK
jgi:hypothetical protein